MEEIKNGISRRRFLTGTGAAVSGFVAGSILGTNTAAFAYSVAAGSYAWPAGNNLSLSAVKEKAFDAYNEPGGGCCYGAAKGLIEQLKIQAPGSGEWDVIPQDMFKWGAGGALSWGTLCGALNGALFVLNCALKGHAQYSNAVDELMSWYQKTALPVADPALDTYIDGKGGSWPGYNDTVMASQTTCFSPLCHASVSTWCEAAGKTSTSNEKKCRCARVTADTAAKAAEIINAVKAGSTAGGWTKANTDNDECITCHQPSADPSRFDEQGKMDCIECHVPGPDVTDSTPEKSNKAPKCSGS